MGTKNFFTHPQVNHVWIEEISYRGFPGKWKSVGRMAEVAVAETVVAVTETGQKQ